MQRRSAGCRCAPGCCRSLTPARRAVEGLPRRQLEHHAAAALACYARGDFRTGGTQRVDLDIKDPVAPHTTLLGHLGYENVPHFSGFNFVDWRAGAAYELPHGFTISAEAVGANTKEHVLFVATSTTGKTEATDKTTVVVALSKKW